MLQIFNINAMAFPCWNDNCYKTIVWFCQNSWTG